MKVSELARITGVTAETVRHYTREGLLSPDRDPDNGYHLYGDRDRERLDFIQRARTLGFSLAEIGDILSHADQGDSPCPMVRDLLAERLPKIRRRIAELEALAARMEDAMQSWQHLPDGVPDGHSLCRLIESVPTAPGARLHHAHTAGVLMNRLEEHQFQVTGMSCQGCVGRMRRAIQERDTDAQVDGDPGRGTLSVASRLDPAELTTLLSHAGYPAEAEPSDVRRPPPDRRQKARRQKVRRQKARRQQKHRPRRRRSRMRHPPPRETARFWRLRSVWRSRA